MLTAQQCIQLPSPYTFSTGPLCQPSYCSILICLYSGALAFYVLKSGYLPSATLYSQTVCLNDLLISHAKEPKHWSVSLVEGCSHGARLHTQLIECTLIQWCAQPTLLEINVLLHLLQRALSADPHSLLLERP